MASRADLLFKRSVIINGQDLVDSVTNTRDLTIFPAGTRTSSMNERLRKVVDSLGLTDALNDAERMAAIMGAPIAVNNGVYSVPPNQAGGAANLVANRAAEYGNLSARVMQQYETTYYEAVNDGSTLKDAHDYAIKMAKAFTEDKVRTIKK